jgi:AAA domain
MSRPDANSYARANGPAALRDAIDFGVQEKLPFKLFRDLGATSGKQWLVHKLLGAGEASVMYGRPGDGKSVLAEDLGLHVAADLEWHGRRVAPGAVLYIALERRQLVERRAIAFSQFHGITDIPFAIMGGVLDFRSKQTAEHLVDVSRQVQAATGKPVKLVVVDTLSRGLCGGDENSSKDMGAIVGATGLMQERTGAHVLWLHHTPIDAGERMRGHGALLGAVDTTISVVRTETVRTATVVKANDAEEGEQVAFNLQSVEIGRGDDGEVTTAPVVTPATAPTTRAASASKGLTKAASIALQALQQALAEQGEHAAASNNIPAGTRVVLLDTWRSYAYKRGITSSDEPRARQVAFQRGFEALLAAKRAGFWDRYAWLA